MSDVVPPRPLRETHPELHHRIVMLLQGYVPMPDQDGRAETELRLLAAKHGLADEAVQFGRDKDRHGPHLWARIHVNQGAVGRWWTIKVY